LFYGNLSCNNKQEKFNQRIIKEGDLNLL